MWNWLKFAAVWLVAPIAIAALCGYFLSTAALAVVTLLLCMAALLCFSTASGPSYGTSGNLGAAILGLACVILLLVMWGVALGTGRIEIGSFIDWDTVGGWFSSFRKELFR